MAQFDIFTSLPTSLSRNVLRDWLTIKSVLALDSSYCGKAARSCFQNLLESGEYFVREKVTLDAEENELSSIWHALPRIGRNLRFVEFREAFSSLQGKLVTSHCQKLIHVEYAGPDCAPLFLQDVLRANKSLEILHMRLFELRNLAEDMFSPAGIFLPNLRTLSIALYRFNHQHIDDALQMSSNIVQLDLFGSNVAISTMLQIPHHCPHLTSLGLAATQLNDDILMHITSICSRIQHLDLEGILAFEEDDQEVTDAGILAVVQNLTRLRSLNIKDNANITDASLVHIYTHCASTLETLHFSCRFEDGEGYMYGARAVNELLHRCSLIKNIYFDYWHEDGAFDSGITLPTRMLSNLTTLILKGNIVCERNLTAIGMYGTNLRTLGILEQCRYTYDTLMEIYEGCTKLKELYLDLSTEEAGLNTNTNICEFNAFAMRLWMRNRPGLVISNSIPYDVEQFCVLHF